MMQRHHGGPDAQGCAPWDFSTNANAAGPCPSALERMALADPTRYPDPAYTALKSSLATFHGVDAHRVVLAASASEFIMRITAAVARAGGQQFWKPAQSYGDYAHAAHAWGLTPVDSMKQAHLVWLCEPSSPAGNAEPAAQQSLDSTAVVVLDRAYEPLRLDGRASLDAQACVRMWQLWSPNKALGLTGVRAAYAIAPAGEASWPLANQLERMAPSWVLGSQGVAMLEAWISRDAQHWLANSLTTLRSWKQAQLQVCHDLGWTTRDSLTPFYLCAWPGSDDAESRGRLIQHYRQHGLKLRDADSLGCPGWLRISVQPPASQDALRRIVQELSP